MPKRTNCILKSLWRKPPRSYSAMLSSVTVRLCVHRFNNPKIKIHGISNIDVASCVFEATSDQKCATPTASDSDVYVIQTISISTLSNSISMKGAPVLCWISSLHYSTCAYARVQCYDVHFLALFLCSPFDAIAHVVWSHDFLKSVLHFMCMWKTISSSTKTAAPKGHDERVKKRIDLRWTIVSHTHDCNKLVASKEFGYFYGNWYTIDN